MPRPDLTSPMLPCRATRGFTLVELLAVVAIIGVLAAITLVAVGKIRESARATRCTENLREISRALLLFAGDNRGALPPGYVWDRSVAPYLGITLLSSATSTPPSSLFICPDDTRTLASPRSYVASAQSTTNPGIGVFSRSSTSDSLRLSTIANPNVTILVTEFYTGGWASSSQFNTAYPTVDGWLGISAAPVLDDGSPYHGSGQNYAFCDGHVERLTPSQVVTSRGFPNGGRWRAYQP